MKVSISIFIPTSSNFVPSQFQNLMRRNNIEATRIEGTYGQFTVKTSENLAVQNFSEIVDLLDCEQVQGIKVSLVKEFETL